MHPNSTGSTTSCVGCARFVYTGGALTGRLFMGPAARGFLTGPAALGLLAAGLLAGLAAGGLLTGRPGRGRGSGRRCALSHGPRRRAGGRSAVTPATSGGSPAAAHIAPHQAAR